VRKLSVLTSSIVLFLMGLPLFAQEGAAHAAASDGKGWGYWLAAGFGFPLAVGLAALSQGKAASAACEGAARNPSIAGNLQTMMIIGLAFIESLVLYALVVVFMKIK